MAGLVKSPAGATPGLSLSPRPIGPADLLCTLPSILLSGIFHRHWPEGILGHIWDRSVLKEEFRQGLKSL